MRVIRAFVRVIPFSVGVLCARESVFGRSFRLRDLGLFGVFCARASVFGRILFFLRLCSRLVFSLAPANASATMVSRSCCELRALTPSPAMRWDAQRLTPLTFPSPCFA